MEKSDSVRPKQEVEHINENVLTSQQIFPRQTVPFSGLECLSWHSVAIDHLSPGCLSVWRLLKSYWRVAQEFYVLTVQTVCFWPCWPLIAVPCHQTGVEQLSSLQHLDLAYNLLLEHSQLAPLSLLHCLNSVRKHTCACTHTCRFQMDKLSFASCFSSTCRATRCSSRKPTAAAPSDTSLQRPPAIEWVTMMKYATHPSQASWSRPYLAVILFVFVA